MADYSQIPDELKQRDQWLLWDRSADTPRRPHWNGDFQVSWSDPNAWHSFDEAKTLAESQSSWGIGYVTALDNENYGRGLYGVIDIDGGVEERGRPKDWVPDLQQFIDADAYMEYSPSGEGIHIPVVGQERPEWWKDVQFEDNEHEGVDYLTNKFCTFTGDALEPAGSGVVDVSEIDAERFFYDAYRAITGDAPRKGDESADAGTGSHDDEEWLDDEAVAAALDNIDPDVDYATWRNLGFAVHDYDDGPNGKRLFREWSQDGEKWDKDAERNVEHIWNNAEAGSGVTVKTLVHIAQQNGWDASEAARQRTDGSGVTAAQGGGGSETVQADTPDTEADDDWSSVRLLFSDDENREARFNASQLLMSNHSWRNIEESDVLYYYDPQTGIYHSNGDSRVREIARRNLQGQFAKKEVGEIAEHLRAANTVRQDQMGGPAGMIAAKNGVIDLTEDRELKEHDPEHEFKSRIATAYDPEADCPVFKEFIKDVVTSDDDRKKLQEFAGYTLMHWELPFHKALFVVGPEASGKSTFLDAIRALHGDDRVASLSPQQMTQRFGGAELFEKWVNIRNDIPAETVKNTGEFKEIIAGDPIKAERKRKDPFMFKPTAKHMFAANQLPDTENDDAAFYRRILLVAFPNTVPRSERDLELDGKIRDELPGVLNWALDGLDRLLAQGKFTGDVGPSETARMWDKWGNTVDRFAQTCIDTGVRDADPIPKKEVYRVYQSFCEEESMPKEMQQEMTRRLKTEHGAEDGRTSINGRQTRAFLNIEFTSRGEGYRDSDDDRDAQQTGL